MLLRAGRQYLSAAQFKVEAYDLSGAEALLLVLIDQMGEPRRNALLDVRFAGERRVG